MTQETAITPSFILGTAGHIDHGKSSLVQALTGTDPDRLAEEKRRGITIELGFAALRLPSGNVCGVVDVPGHERFVRHMVEGASGVDLALLVVAADDGVMVQTREHLTILELLGIRNLIVALTKIDIVDPDLRDLAAFDVAELLRDTAFADSPIVSVSALSGEGLPELLATIEFSAANIKRKTYSDLVRLPIDRVFSIEGAGTVVTGTLWDGTICTDDQLELISSARTDSTNSNTSNTSHNKQVRVRSIQVHGKTSAKAKSGQRVALNLSGISRTEIKRGEMLCTPGTMHASTQVYAQLHYSGMPKDIKGLQTSLKDGATVLLHHGTRDVVARVKLLFKADTTTSSLAAGNNSFVQLRLEQSLPLRYGDRFIIRNLSPAFTIGGGTVLMTGNCTRTKLCNDWLDLLQLLDGQNSEAAVLHFVELQNTPQSGTEISRKLNIERTEVARILNQSDLSRLKTEKETAYLPATALRDVQARTEKALLAWHDHNPQSLDISQGALHGLIFPHTDSLSSKAWTDERFEAVLHEMAQSSTIVFDSGKVSHPKASARVQALHDQLTKDLFAQIDQQGLSVETVAELSARLNQPRELVAQVLGQMTKDGTLIRLGGEYHFAPERISTAQKILVTELNSRGKSGITAAEARDLWQISRKYAIWLLEYFDARGITVRDSDVRHLR